MLLQFDLKHIHKVNFYPSDNNFTQALLVLLVTNMISAFDPQALSQSHPMGYIQYQSVNIETAVSFLGLL